MVYGDRIRRRLPETPLDLWLVFWGDGAIGAESRQERPKSGGIGVEWGSADEKMSLTLKFNLIFAGRCSIGVGFSIGFKRFLVGHFADSCGVGARPFRDHRHFGVDFSAVQFPGLLHVYGFNSFCR